MRVTFDREANMAYIYLVDRPDAGQAIRQVAVSEPGAPRIVLDLDREGTLIGIEVFDARETLPAELLDQARPS